MKTFYSLIKVSPNTSAGDLITVGIIVAGQSGVLYKISESKIKSLHSFLHHRMSLLDHFIKQLSHKVAEANKNIENNKNLLFENQHLFTPEYFEYLNRYSNNLIQFSKPSLLFEDINKEKFEKLYQVFVGFDQPEIKKETVNEKIFSDKIEKKLVSRVKDKVHTNIVFSDKIISSLYFKFEMDCIGLNGVLTGAKSLYFNKSPQTIHAHVSDYITLITEIEKEFNKEGVNNFYLIADEPERQTKEHALWQKMRELKKIKLITSDDSDEVAEKIENSKAAKFLF